MQTAALAENGNAAVQDGELDGVYAKNIHWSISEEGVLSITPEGEQAKAVAMANGKTADAYPWKENMALVHTVEVGDGVSSVGSFAFQGAGDLKTVTLSADVTTISAGAFQDCTGLESLTLDAGLETVQQQAFQGCTELTSVALGPKLGTVGASAFQDCEKLETMTLAGGLGKLDASMLNGCTALKTVTLMGTEAAPLAIANNTGGSPFRNTASLETLIFSGPFTNLGTNAFALYDKDGSAANTNGTFTKGDANYLPTALSTADLSGLEVGKVTAVPEGLFMGCSALSEVTLPEGITDIGIRAFLGCTALKTITLPAGVTNVRDSAFQGSALESLTLPASVTTIGASACEACTSLASVTFPADMNAVGAGAFKNCAALASLKFPRTTTSFTMGVEAFSGCTSLASASLHLIRNAKFNLPNGAFQGCSSLAAVELPDNLTAVGESAFQACTSLKSITLPKKVTAVGKRAFSECTALRRFEIQGSGVTLGEEAFSSCASLTAAIIPEGVQTIADHAFQYCDAMLSAVIPTTVKTVSAEVFFRCANLQHVYYPGVESEWMAIKDGDKLRDYLSRNYVNQEETLVLDWDKQALPVSDGYESGGNSGGGDEAPLNPGDPANAYGRNLPAKITGVSASDSGVTAKVLGAPGEGAVLFAAAYSSGGELLDARTVEAPAAGTYTAAVSTDGADYVYLFLLNSSAPVAEKYSLYLN